MLGYFVVIFIYITVFLNDLKQGTVVGEGGHGVIVICFKIGLFNFSQVFGFFFSLFLIEFVMIVVSIIVIIIITTIVMFVIFYTCNQYNYLITYISFKCCS